MVSPLGVHDAGHAGGEGSGAALFGSRFTTFTYSGVLLGPALIGSVAQVIGLTWTLAALLPVVLLLAAVGLPGDRDPHGTVDGERKSGHPVPEIIAA